MELRGWCADLEMHSKEWKKVVEKQRIRKVKTFQVEGAPLSTLRIRKFMAHTWRTDILKQWEPRSPRWSPVLCFCNFMLFLSPGRISPNWELSRVESESSSVPWSSIRVPQGEKEMATHSSVLAWESHGWRSLVGCSPWGHTESDTTVVT